MALYNTLTMEQNETEFIFHLNTDNPLLFASWKRISESDLVKTTDSWLGVWNILIEFFRSEQEALIPFLQSVHNYQDIAILSNWFYAFHYNSYIITEDNSVGVVMDDVFYDCTMQAREDLKLADKEEFADFILDEGIEMTELCKYMDNPPLVPTENQESIYMISGDIYGMKGDIIKSGW